jgi:hypothetical protein
MSYDCAMGSRHPPQRFSRTSIRFECAGDMRARVAASVEELVQIIREFRPTAIEIPDLVPASTPVDTVLSADWQWRARLRLALRRADMRIADSYLTPRLDQFTLRVVCRSLQ